jgi:hypothetical protein
VPPARLPRPSSTSPSGEQGRLREVRGGRAAVPLGGGRLRRRRIPLAGLPEGPTTVDVVADCAYERVGVGLHRVVDPADQQVYLYTHFEPFDAHKVIACFDQPDLKGTAHGGGARAGRLGGLRQRAACSGGTTTATAAAPGGSTPPLPSPPT